MIVMLVLWLLDVQQSVRLVDSLVGLAVMLDCILAGSELGRCMFNVSDDYLSSQGSLV